VCLSGGGGRLRVLCQAPAGDSLLGAQLLRRVRQCGRNDERGRDAHVLLPGRMMARTGIFSCWYSVFVGWIISSGMRHRLII
jgi:hypothetical protein